MPSAPNPISTWTHYFKSMMDKPLHPLYTQLDPLLPERGQALELGAGVGHGVVHLVSKGLHVTAVDAEPEAVSILRYRAPLASVLEARFEEIELPFAYYDVVVAGFSLFFLTATELEEFWPRLVLAIKVGGLFAGEFLGLNDDWVRKGYLAHTEDEVRNMLSSFEIRYWEEADRGGQTSDGTSKHWHVYHVIAQRIG